MYPASCRNGGGSSTTSNSSTPSSSTRRSTGCRTGRPSSAGPQRPAGIPLRRQARRVRLAPHEAARRPPRGCRTTSTGSSVWASTSAPPSCSSRRAGSATSSGSTSSSPSAPQTMRWAVELREPSWLHDDVFEVLRRHGAALCIHDLLADHPFELTTDWTYVRFHGPDALQPPVPRRVRPGGGCAGRPSARRRARRVATCTPTSTTTGSATPYGCDPSSSSLDSRSNPNTLKSQIQDYQSRRSARRCLRRR